MLLVVDAFRMHPDKEGVIEHAAGVVINVCARGTLSTSVDVALSTVMPLRRKPAIA